MTQQCQPITTEAHLWNRLRQCQYNNEAAAARIHALETALRNIYEWYDRDGSVGEADRIFEGNRAALNGVARTLPDPEPPAHAEPIKSHTRRYGHE